MPATAPAQAKPSLLTRRPLARASTAPAIPTIPQPAICHGVLVLARARDAEGRSVLHGRKTTCLPKYMERTAYYLTAWKLGDYYRTYPAYVEDEVREAVGPRGAFERGPIHLVSRGTRNDHRPTFLVEDGAYLSGRWPGDAYAIGARFAEMLSEATAVAAE